MVIGRTIGRYRIVERIGAGGMGEVFRAHDALLQRDFALKLLHVEDQGDEAARKRFLREARLAASLSHPHICSVFEVGEDESDVFIAMEYVAGRPLSSIVAEGPPSISQCLRHAIQIAEALEHAHGRGVLHRDLKTANVVVGSDGSAKVLDFGLAKRIENESATAGITRSASFRTQPGTVVGTLPYMAPELLLGHEADRRTDIYSFGALLYEMTTGRPPFDSTHQTELIADIQRKTPESPRRLNSRIPPDLARIILKCLEKSPDRRYAKVEDLLADLRRVGAGGVPRWAIAIGATAAVAFVIVVGNTPKFGCGKTRPPAPVKIAVLPFTNLSSGQDREFFSAGLTEEMIVQLANIRPDRLAVIGRTSVATYEGARRRFNEIGRELGANYVLEGSVRSDGERVRITVQLIDAKTQTNLWGETYDRNFEDILAVQSSVSREVCRALSIELSVASSEPDHRPVNPEAYEAYLRGRDLYWKTPRSAAVASFERAIELDPGYARAHAAYAWALVGDGDVPAAERVRKVEQAAAKALALDPTLAEAYYALAFERARLRWDFVAADEANRKALELGAGDARAVSLCAVNLLTWGRIEEALELGRRALELDPLSFSALNICGYMNYYARNYREAVPYLLKAVAGRTDASSIHYNLGRCYLQMDRLSEARSAFRQAMGLAATDPGGLTRAGLACTAIAEGTEAAALGILSSLAREPRTDLARAEILAALKRYPEAIDLLEHAYAERENMMAYVQVEPLLDPLRDQPRFKELVRRMRFPDV